MAGLTLRDVRKRYGDVQVMHGVDLDIEDGEFVVFVTKRSTKLQPPSAVWRWFSKPTRSTRT